jgi:hypothetical protein
MMMDADGEHAVAQIAFRYDTNGAGQSKFRVDKDVGAPRGFQRAASLSGKAPGFDLPDECQGRLSKTFAGAIEPEHGRQTVAAP